MLHIAKTCKKVQCTLYIKRLKVLCINFKHYINFKF